MLAPLFVSVALAGALEVDSPRGAAVFVDGERIRTWRRHAYVLDGVSGAVDLEVTEKNGAVSAKAHLVVGAQAVLRVRYRDGHLLVVPSLTAVEPAATGATVVIDLDEGTSHAVRASAPRPAVKEPELPPLETRGSGGLKIRGLEQRNARVFAGGQELTWNARESVFEAPSWPSGPVDLRIEKNARLMFEGPVVVPVGAVLGCDLGQDRSQEGAPLVCEAIAGPPVVPGMYDRKPLSAEDLAALRQALAREPFVDDQVRLLEATALTWSFQSAQIAALLPMFPWRRERARVVAVLRPALVDEAGLPQLLDVVQLGER